VIWPNGLKPNKPGQLIGAAYDASFILAEVEDIESEFPIEEDRYVAGLEFVEMHGTDLATSSLGYDDWLEYDDMDGRTAVSTRAVNIATSMGLICVTGSREQWSRCGFTQLDRPVRCLRCNCLRGGRGQRRPDGF